MLKCYDWPGNIRELQNFVERGVIMSSGPVFRPHLAELRQIGNKAAALPARTLADAERDHIIQALEATNWVVGGHDGAAARLGIPRTTLKYRMQKLGISRNVTRAAPATFPPA